MSFYIGFYWPFILIIFIPLIFYLSRHSLTGLSPWRNRATLILRIILLLLLILALANIQVVKKSKQLSVLFLLDASESIPMKMQDRALDLIQKNINSMDPKHDKVGLLIFGKDASFEFVDRKYRYKVGGIESLVNTEQTNIGNALKLAIAGLPEVGQRRIVLISDGNQTIGSCIKEARQSKAYKIPIDVIPITMKSDKEVKIVKLIVPNQLNESQAYEVSVVVHSTQKTSAILRLFISDEMIRKRNVQLKKGKNNIRTTVPAFVSKSGFHKLKATIESLDDVIIANNSAESFTYVHGVPKVLYLEGDFASKGFIVNALKSLTHSSKNRIEIDPRGPGELPRNIVELNNYDAIIISNVARNSFDSGQMRMIESAVKESGLGLIMIGGDKSFGAGGYRNTPIERALPVDMDITHKKIIPNGAIAIILHTCEFPDGNLWGKRISKKAIEVLSPADYAGVLFYSYQKNESWLFPLTQVKYKKKMFQLIDGAQPGDMPNFQPTLQAAYNGLSQISAARRHVIIITDGDPTLPPINLMNNIKKSKISISTITIRPHGGPGSQDIAKMRYIAQYTGGKAYYVNNPNRLPAIFVKEALTIKRSLIFESTRGFQATLGYHTKPLKGIGASEIPKVYGYVVTSPKPLAKVPIYIPHEDQKDPLLAHMHYGLGRTLAFTSDAKNRWAADWVSWDKYRKFWIQNVRWVLRKIERSGFKISTSLVKGSLNIAVDAISETGEQVNFLEIKGAVVYPSGRTKKFTIRQDGLGRYKGKVAADEVGTYLVTANYRHKGKTRHLNTGFSVSYSAEYSSTEANMSLLSKVAKLTGGRLLKYKLMDHNGDGVISIREWNGTKSAFAKLDINGDGELGEDEYQDGDIFLREKARGGKPTELWPLLLTLFLILFPIDVFVRRVLIDYGKVWQAFIAFLTNKQKDSGVSSQTMQRLAMRKAKIQKKTPRKSTLDLKKLEKLGARADTQFTKEKKSERIPDTPSLPTKASEKKSSGSTKAKEAGEVSYTNRLLEAKKEDMERQKQEIRLEDQLIHIIFKYKSALLHKNYLDIKEREEDRSALNALYDKLKNINQKILDSKCYVQLTQFHKEQTQRFLADDTTPIQRLEMLAYITRSLIRPIVFIHSKAALIRTIQDIEPESAEILEAKEEKKVSILAECTPRSFLPQDIKKMNLEIQELVKKHKTFVRWKKRLSISQAEIVSQMVAKGELEINLSAKAKELDGVTTSIVLTEN